MGMYSQVSASGSSRKLFKCAAGHLLVNLQTKTFESGVERYFINNGLLYSSGTWEDDQIRRPTAYIGTAKELTITNTIVAVRVKLTALATIYDSCLVCKPVLYPDLNKLNCDRIGERSPWCEWLVQIERGKVTGVRPVKLESRDAVRRELERQFKVKTIPDSDPKAIVHFQMMEDVTSNRRRHW